jgi:hypothetical protein
MNKHVVLALNIDENTSIWNILSTDLVKYIFLFLPRNELYQICMVCKPWNNLILQLPKYCHLRQSHQLYQWTQQQIQEERQLFNEINKILDQIKSTQKPILQEDHSYIMSNKIQVKFAIIKYVLKAFQLKMSYHMEDILASKDDLETKLLLQEYERLKKDLKIRNTDLKKFKRELKKLI